MAPLGHHVAEQLDIGDQITVAVGKWFFKN